MGEKTKKRKRCGSFLLAFSMLFTAVSSHGALSVSAEEKAAENEKAQEIQNTDASGMADLNEGWKFYLADRTPQEAEGGFAAAGVKDAGEYTTAEIAAVNFDDTGWRTVDVPHDFSIEGEKVSSSVDAQAYLQGGLGYYRKHFTVSEAYRGSKISLDFEGVYQNSVVYLNGQEIGSYPNGYTGFALDVTDQVKFGAENILVVKVQNMSPSGRWYTGSGILRPVHLVIDNPVRWNRNGITLGTPSLETDYASGCAYLDVKAEGYSEGGNSTMYMNVTVLDAEGSKVAEKRTENISMNPNTAFTAELSGNNAVNVPKVKLWYPWNLGEPYLYTVKVDLYLNESGADFKLVDSEEIEYGFRWMEIKESTSDPDSGGLYINGAYTKIQGVDLHHDSGAVGAASYTDAYSRQFDKLIDMGVNAYRTSHCPPSKQALEVCRRKGILVVEEAFDGWGTPKSNSRYDFGNFFFQEVPTGWAGLKPNGYHTNLPEPGVVYSGAKLTWSDWVIREMVSRDKNEPSIIAWSIGNEVRSVGTKPSWYDVSQYDILGVNPSGMNFYTEAVRLMKDIKALDETRYVVMGGDQERSAPEVASDWGYVNQVLDGYGLNYNTAKSVDTLIDRFSIGSGLLEKGTKTFFFESESSSQTSSRGVYLDPQFSNTGINQTPGRRGGSNYDNDFASWTMSNEYGLKKDRDRKRFVGQFIWSGFDYLGEPTPYENIYPMGVSSFGTIDTAGFPKDSFYLYKSQWTEEPMAHLLPGNWDQWHKGETVTVWVNTNQPSAELFLNGKSLGKKSFDEKETAYGKKYYETSEKTQDDKTWGDSGNPGGYTSTGAKLDEGELNSGRLHLTWEVPYEPGTLEVKAYDEKGGLAASDSVTTSSVPYTIQAKADKTVLAADGTSLSYVECTVVDEDGNMVPDVGNLIKFDVSGDAVSIFGVDNGQQENTELYKYGNIEKNSHSERKAYNGKVLVILKSNRKEGDAELTISSDGLKPMRLLFKVTEDGTGSAPAAFLVTDTESSVDPVEISVPAGMEVTLPSAVKVNYTSNAGSYSVMRNVTWGMLTGGKAEGTIEGCSLKAQAAVTENASMETDTELAANKAKATASFTGNNNSYPEKMVDGNAGTSWTNMYNRQPSVLLPANSASRKSEYVEFFWDDAQLFNQIILHFNTDRGRAVPAVFEAQYWDGAGWTEAVDQIQTADGASVKIRFHAVYAEKIRVYMENATPFTENGNMEISEVSVMLSTETTGAQIRLADGEAEPEESITSGIQLHNLPEDQKLKEIRFSLDYNEDVFENPEITLSDESAGTLKTEQKEGKTVYVWTAAEGQTPDYTDFAALSLKVKAEAKAGSYRISLQNLAAKDENNGTIAINVRSAAVVVKSIQDPVEAKKSILKTAIDAAKELNGRDYTAETFEALTNAVSEAERVYADQNATVGQIEAQMKKIAEAVASLKTPDAEDYQKLLQQLKEQQAKAEEERRKALAEISAAQAELERLKNAGSSGASFKTGAIEEYKGVIYRVTDAAKKQAAAYGTVKADVKSVKIEDTVMIYGVSCTVTSIGNNAFASLPKLSKVTIGKNVSMIGTKAFFGDKKLKTIQVKGTDLKKVGKNALKNISAKAVIKVPKSKKSAYAKIFKGKGQKKSVKLK